MKKRRGARGAQKLGCFDFDKLEKMKPVGVIGIRYFERVYALSTVGHVEVNIPSQALKMIDSGRADYTAGTQEVIKLLMELTDVKLQRCFDESIMLEAHYTYIHSKNKQLVKPLTEAYKQIFETK